MVERGARPQVSRMRQNVARFGRRLTTPLVPDDYFELINPRWSMRELRGHVVEVIPETATSHTIVIRPSAPWRGHRAGQYLRVGVEINGIRHWRAYTLTSDPDHPEGLLSITVKHVDEGRVSPWFHEACKPGETIFLGDAEGTFAVPNPVPDKVLMISAGSGITPIWSLLRELAADNHVADVTHIHCCHDRDDFIFGAQLVQAAETEGGYTLIPHYRCENDRLTPTDLDRLCPDWRERTTFLSGPGELIDTFVNHWNQHGDRDLLHLERFQPVIGGDATVGVGAGGTIRFRVTDFEATSDGRVSILEAGERAGGTLPHGCRMGVCHTCKCTLVHGKVRDLRTGEVSGEPGESIRTCINAPEGHIELDEGHVVIKGTNPRSQR